MMNSAEGFFVDNTAQQERAHPQSDSSEVPAVVGWVILMSERPEKVILVWANSFTGRLLRMCS
jgi:hypothetical protein